MNFIIFRLRNNEAEEIEFHSKKIRILNDLGGL